MIPGEAGGRSLHRRRQRQYTLRSSIITEALGDTLAPRIVILAVHGQYA
jgi:hypothetical protein